MSFLDKMVREAERELKEMNDTIENLDRNIADLIERRDAKIADEKEARKLYKMLRNRQPSKPETTQYVTTTGTFTTPRPASDRTTVIKPPIVSNSKPDYEGAIEVLKAEGKEFNLTEWAELVGTDRKVARSKLVRLTDDGVIVKTQDGDRNTYDSAKWRIK